MSDINQSNSLNEMKFIDLYQENSKEQNNYNSINVYEQFEDKNSESISLNINKY